ncbi:hypothetical protein AXG93_4751s1310 [Marchantia polymorpha subsp. ruderalis]|uniref:Legume lectin domain-containing protein n=1 Tax=Marchantia polymorpha subsp. ruderalis TaxID=1480154 RepID=A0A176VE99_MARPO|nr:hypothetical protein AXG93_4751s1310 [Marchantia polymorpha subsp. ruderalis]
MKNPGAAAVLLVCLAVFSSTLSLAAAANDFNLSLKDIGLLVNFSVPCDLDSRIAVPDRGGLLTPNLLAIGHQEYKYDGSKWVFNAQSANLFNKTLAKVGTLAGAKDGSVTFSLFANQKGVGTTDAASVTAKPIQSVLQRFAIPLQLLNVTSTMKGSKLLTVARSARMLSYWPAGVLNVAPVGSAWRILESESGYQQDSDFSLNFLLLTVVTTDQMDNGWNVRRNYASSDYIQRFGTQTGLAPGSTYPAKLNDIFRSRFTAFYAFYLPIDLSPQLATRVPRCGDERFYGLQYGRDF